MYLHRYQCLKISDARQQRRNLSYLDVALATDERLISISLRECQSDLWKVSDLAVKNNSYK